MIANISLPSPAIVSCGSRGELPAVVGIANETKRLANGFRIRSTKHSADDLLRALNSQRTLNTGRLSTMAAAIGAKHMRLEYCRDYKHKYFQELLGY